MSDSAGFLVVGPAWVGDMVMAQALYKLLRRRHPDAAIDVVAPPWSLPILARMPEVRRGIELDVGHGQLGLRRRWVLGRRLRRAAYRQALVLPRSFKAALVPYFAQVPVRTGFLGEARYGLINDRRPLDAATLDQTVKRFVALGLAPGETPADIERPLLTVDAMSRESLRARYGLAAGGVAMMPGAEYGPAKQWPAERYAEAARRLAEHGLEIWLLGSMKERTLGATIAAAAGSRVRNLCGETTLADAIDLLGAARVAVTNDSGLMHVAAAVGTHVVAIYGSSSPRYTPPLTDARTIFHLDLECSPCFERTCPLRHLRCLREISAETVVAAVLEAIAATPARD